jgi:hypothetical protein
MLNDDDILLVPIIIPIVVVIIYMVVDSEHGEVPSILSLDFVCLPSITEVVHEGSEVRILF